MVRSRGVCFSDFFGLEERSRENISTSILVPLHCDITTCSVVSGYQAQAGNKTPYIWPHSLMEEARGLFCSLGDTQALAGSAH